MPHPIRTDTTFAVPPPPALAWWSLLLPLAAAAIGLAVGLRRGPDSFADAPFQFALAVGIFFLLATLLIWALKRHVVALEGNTLVVKAAMFSRRIDTGTLDLERVRVVDLAEHVELKPTLRSLGMALPGFKAGWYRMRNGGNGFYLLTAQRRVLWLPARSGTDLLLSLEQPQALLSALRRQPAHRV